MKYTKPELHLISAVAAEAKCTNGSSAASTTECTEGTNIGQSSCSPGWAAGDYCGIGHAATTECSLTGATQGENCVFGDKP
jgi:hypothetical protein